MRTSTHTFVQTRFLWVFLCNINEVRRTCFETLSYAKNLLTWLNSIHTVWAGSIAVPVPLRWHILPEFIFWHYKDGHSLTMEIIFSLHNGLPVSALGEGSVAVSSPGFPIPVRQRPCPVEKWVPRLLKGPTCQRSRGISHSQPSYCSPGHNRLHGARPFVINSVVNFCWGNKSVTHLQLWIRSFFLHSFFFSLVFFSFFSDTLPMAVLATSNVIFETKKQAYLVNTRSNGGQDMQIIFLIFPVVYRHLPVIQKYFYFGGSILICWNDL